MKYFIDVCKTCNQIAVETKSEYKGMVNLDIRPLFKGKAIIKYKCFTCGMIEIIPLSDEPHTKEELVKTIEIQNKKTRAENES